MRLIIVHSKTSGMGRPSGRVLVKTFTAAGHDVIYRSAQEEDWEDGLEAGADATVAAGGDGTVRQVALALARRRSPRPLVILPLGTSNNIAGHFGIAGPPEHHARALAEARAGQLAVGLGKSDWGEKRFVESAGVGTFGTMMHAASNGGGRPSGSRAARMRKGLRDMRQRIATARPRRLTVLADGRDLSGSYIMVEAMNTSLMGARLELAPSADAAGPELVLVRCGPKERGAFLEYLDCRLKDQDCTLHLPSLWARRVEIEWPVKQGHMDDQRWPDPAAIGRERSAMVALQIGLTIPLLLTGAPVLRSRRGSSPS